MSKANNITTLTSFKEYQVAITTGVSIIKFSGAWCAPCKRIAGPYQVLADTNTSVQFYQLDIDEAPEVTVKEQVSAIPAFIIYYNGERLSSYIGANEQKLSEILYKGLAYIDSKKSLLSDPLNDKLSSLTIDDNSDLDI